MPAATLPFCLSSSSRLTRHENRDIKFCWQKCPFKVKNNLGQRKLNNRIKQFSGHLKIIIIAVDQSQSEVIFQPSPDSHLTTASCLVAPSSLQAVPSSGGEVPSSGGEAPSSGGEAPSSGGEVPQPL
jgi:hypothetical protein